VCIVNGFASRATSPQALRLLELSEFSETELVRQDIDAQVQLQSLSRQSLSPRVVRGRGMGSSVASDHDDDDDDDDDDCGMDVLDDDDDDCRPHSSFRAEGEGEGEEGSDWDYNEQDGRDYVHNTLEAVFAPPPSSGDDDDDDDRNLDEYDSAEDERYHVAGGEESAPERPQWPVLQRNRVWSSRYNDL
jgi:hypothetical protein